MIVINIIQWKARWNGWWWVGRQSGVGWDKEIFVWTASDETWEIICEVQVFLITIILGNKTS